MLDTIQQSIRAQLRREELKREREERRKQNPNLQLPWERNSNTSTQSDLNTSADSETDSTK